jgi:hypothetical protein
MLLNMQLRHVVYAVVLNESECLSYAARPRSGPRNALGSANVENADSANIPVGMPTSGY